MTVFIHYITISLFFLISISKIIRLLSIALIGIFITNFSALSLGSRHTKAEIIAEIIHEVTPVNPKTPIEPDIFFPEKTPHSLPQKNTQHPSKKERSLTLSKNFSQMSIHSSEEIKRDTTQEPKKCIVPATIPKEIEVDFQKATENIPCNLLQTLRKVEIFEDPRHIFPRAMANGRILKIRKDAISDPEFIQVLIHELGHVVDLGGLRSKTFTEASVYKDGKKIIYADDLSVLFYKISWDSESQKKQGSNQLDFVGGYASTDMFEDYAESFLMYIEQGNDFRTMAKQNPILEKKYNFFRDHVFSGQEFLSYDTEIKGNERKWDITKY